MPAMFTPAQVCQELNVSAQTLRRWSQTFSSVLSPDACPEAGRKRRYSAADVALLRHAKALFDAGRSAAEVAAILPTVQVAGEDAPSSADAPGAALTIQVSAGERFMLAVVDQKTAIERLTAQVDALTARLAALERVRAPERRRWPAWLWRLVSGRKR